MTSSGDEIHLAEVDAAGQTFLLAFPDIEAARRHDAGAAFVGINREEALRMILAEPGLDGILIATASDNDAWAAVLRDSIEKVLAGSSPATPSLPPEHRPEPLRRTRREGGSDGR